MKIYRAIRSNEKTQSFGDNLACVKVYINGKIVQPLQIKGRVGMVCEPGWKSLYQAGGLQGHNGNDWKAWYGEPGYHAADWPGIASTQHDLYGGLGVDIASTIPLVFCDQCQELHHVKVRYWHLSEALVHEGQVIYPGDRIFRAGSSGASGGDHLHLALKWCTPEGRTLHYENGYAGCIDPTPYEDPAFVLEALGIQDPAWGKAGWLEKLYILAHNFYATL